MHCSFENPRGARGSAQTLASEVMFFLSNPWVQNSWDFREDLEVQLLLELPLQSRFQLVVSPVFSGRRGWHADLPILSCYLSAPRIPCLLAVLGQAEHRFCFSFIHRKLFLPDSHCFSLRSQNSFVSSLPLVLHFYSIFSRALSVQHSDSQEGSFSATWAMSFPHP